MIIEKIDEFYNSKQSSKERTAFYISDAGKCPRAIWFAMKDYPKKATDARTHRIFEHGDHTHMRIMGVLFSLGLATAVEVGIPESEVIHGRADAIVSVKGEPYVVELKSVNSFKFRKGEADADHLKQLQLYMHFFKIKKGLLIYENKDNQELKEFLVEYNEDFAKKILESFEQLKENVVKNIIPPVPEGIEHWRCEYCPYLESCENAVSEDGEAGESGAGQN
jgi:CRISPR-associated protein Cas4